jgi:hypothetical protein
MRQMSKRQLAAHKAVATRRANQARRSNIAKRAAFTRELNRITDAISKYLQTK